MEESSLLAKIRWQCRRGMLELDLMLLDFVEKVFPELSNSEQSTFIVLLTYPDPEIYEWLTNKSMPTNEALKAMVLKIRDFNLTIV